MKIKNIKVRAGHIMDKGLPAKIDTQELKSDAFINGTASKPTLEQGEAGDFSINPFFSSSPCKYLEIDCLVSQMSKHCNNDYTQCQTYKYYERWGK